MDSAKAVVQNLIQSLDLPMKEDGQEFQLGASFGIAIFPDDVNTVDELLELADKRMFANKLERKKERQ